MRILFTILCAVLCTITSYGQESDGWPRKGMPKDEFPQKDTRATGDYLYKEFPTMGEMKGVVILAAFADVPFSVSNDSIHTLLSNRLNADNYSEEIDFEEYSEVFGKYLPLQCTIPGSARDYFRDQSLGQFVPSFDVIGPVTLSQKRAYYGENTSSKGGSDKNAGGMISEACQKAYDMRLTDFTDYDRDGDGTVDFVYVIYAGSDEAQTDIEECIWAKASSISLTLGNGTKISRYACSGELVVDLPVVAGIGTFVHEFSHVLGLPDFYNTKTGDFTMDMWSVMDYGMYNAEGFVPCAYTSFERYSLGWIPMLTLEEPTTMPIGTMEEDSTAYRIFVSDTDTASFYLLETIRQEGWNSYAAAEGLLISEVNYLKSAWTSNEVNVGEGHRYSIVPANNHYSYSTANNHLFGAEKHEFTSTSTPKSVTQFGATMDKPLTNIIYKEGKTTFDFCGGTMGGIEVGPTANSQQPIAIYDLLGRPVANPTKGVYIVNGKKVVINN